MIKRGLIWPYAVMLMSVLFGLSGQPVQAMSSRPQSYQMSTQVRLGETKKVRVYTFGRFIQRKDVAYIDIVVDNTAKRALMPISDVKPAQWGNFSCSGSYTAYNALSQIIYKWSTVQSYSVSPTLNTVNLFDYTTNYDAGGGWVYRSKSYTKKLDGTTQAYAFSQGNFEYPFLSKKALVLSFTINFMEQCSVSWYETSW